ncbi:MAG: hypothetical protein RBS68_15605 [Anaerolineales bacterium]|nr:hypothetical protein [Anaerolineales bacterium]
MLSTVFTSPQREAGISGGRAGWRGNHPPTLSRELIDWLKPGFVIDPMCGSGTTGDVCTHLGIPFWQSDLRHPRLRNRQRHPAGRDGRERRQH